MSASRRFCNLRSRVSEIERHFMPSTRTSGDYTRKECDQMRAYRLLVHAEIESFLEDRAIEVLDRAYSQYQKSKKPNTPLIAVLTYSDLASQGTPKKAVEGHDTCNARLSKACSHFKRKTQHHNNGIKEENVLPLLLPVGLEVAEIDTTLLNTLNSFGRGRGDVAHRSGKTKQMIDPVTEKATATLLIQELEKLDTKLAAIK